MFLPSNMASRQQSKFLPCRQDNGTLYGYVQKLRVSMASGPLLQAVMVTVFMEGLTYGHPKFEVFHQSPTTLEDAIMVALREDYCQRHACDQSVNPMETVTAATGVPELMELSAVTVCRQQVCCYGCQQFASIRYGCHKFINTAVIVMVSNHVVPIPRERQTQ
ncbi:uncharacterized protein PHALS_04825 [Plasmopara halstedii]|uniref:Uncharacterized protein n=1 Tax=Plasmopara halstedii TaxID=4781 RepID=A0A0P1B105_PLAHL|nr:uncharacterized protein PHALS_04825 [Plasmopara halstedii]CEG47678.1 hypothetical protein PHALS_04825 [Plasmopara halstedii]|eukprot:XP_024584047.1 hypothetical protein PHALS_04825 [Plasmopara halstedii]